MTGWVFTASHLLYLPDIVFTPDFGLEEEDDTDDSPTS